MAQTPEGKVKAAVKKILDKHGVYHFSPATGGYGRSGIPDIICCHHGKFIAIECKAGKGTTTVLQERELEAIRAHGGAALVINELNLRDIDTVLETTSLTSSQKEKEQ
jgi:Holliday junction resolvase